MRRIVVVMAALAMALFYGPRAFASGDVAYCDDVQDLVVGVPGEDLAQDGTGLVNVVPGVFENFLNEPFATAWSQDSTDVNDTNQAFDAEGTAVAVGDFDADGCDDLAFGVPGEDVSGFSDGGAVNVIYNDGGNLDASPAANPPPNDQFWTQDASGVPGVVSTGDRFGAALAVGDFDNDTIDDLAIGVPGDLINARDGAGAVNILYGSDGTGLTSSGAQLWHQNSSGVEGGSETGDHFGAALAVGTFNTDGPGDLAIGVPDEDIGSRANAGAVNVLYGSATGLNAAGDDLWHQNVSGIEGTAEAGDHFGAALATGDLGAVEPQDLAIGVPGEAIGTAAGAGAVNVIYGAGSGGLSASGDQVWFEDSSGVKDISEAGDGFGSALASADFDGVGGNDLAIGVPGENGGKGQVHLLYSGSGLQATSPDDQLINQDSTGVEGTAASGDHFGAALVTADYDAGGNADLAVGAPDDDELGASNAGLVNVIFEVGDGTTPGDVDQLIGQDDMNLSAADGDSSESGDRFGAALA